VQQGGSRGNHLRSETETLQVTIGSGQRQLGDACTADESINAYRVVVTFSEALPATVVATEADDTGDNTTTAQNPRS
jgi:hypothetical protein